MRQAGKIGELKTEQMPDEQLQEFLLNAQDPIRPGILSLCRELKERRAMDERDQAALMMGERVLLALDGRVHYPGCGCCGKPCVTEGDTIRAFRAAQAAYEQSQIPPVPEPSEEDLSTARAVCSRVWTGDSGSTAVADVAKILRDRRLKK